MEERKVNNNLPLVLRATILFTSLVNRIGFKGQARVILPTVTSCYECSLDMLTPPTAFPICTIANTPRLPEHCIEWASILEWPRVFKGVPELSPAPDLLFLTYLLLLRQKARQR